MFWWRKHLYKSKKLCISPYFNFACFLLLRGESAVLATWWYRVYPFATDSALPVSLTGNADLPFLDPFHGPTHHSDSLPECTAHPVPPPGAPWNTDITKPGPEPEHPSQNSHFEQNPQEMHGHIYVWEAPGFGLLLFFLKTGSHVAQAALKYSRGWP